MWFSEGLKDTSLRFDKFQGEQFSEETDLTQPHSILILIRVLMKFQH